VCIVVCDGLKGLPDTITTVWPQALAQACVLPPDPQHLPLRLPQALGGHGQGPAPGLCTAPTEAAAAERFEQCCTG
jgi:hypothetical protein